MNFVRDSLGHDQVSERRACRVLGQSRSTQRRQPVVPSDEPRLVREIIDLASQYGRYGYRRVDRVTATARLEGESQASGTALATGRPESPQKQPKRRRLWFNDGSCVRLRPRHRDHVWSYDFVHCRTHDWPGLPDADCAR